MSLDNDVKRIALRFYEGLDTPRALTCALLLQAGEWDQLLKLKTDPLTYLDNQWSAGKFSRDYAATDFLRKCEGLPTQVDTRAAAVESFWSAEKQCKQTNDRLDVFLFNPCFTESEERILEYIHDVQRYVRWVLGPLPESLDGRFGKGAVFESAGARRNFCLGDKMQLQPFTTPGAALLANHYIFGCAWGRALLRASPYRSALQHVRGNRFATVPKTALTDRGICVEPGANVFLQLAVGGHMRRRLLKMAKLDLDDGQLVHRRMARDGSRSGDLATIDLSSASDTVAGKLVKLLLPSDWYQLLDDLRSKTTEIDGQTVFLEKFSSMGNGFTFELETLIFWAIAQVGCDYESGGARALTYGDDIIIPTSAYDVVLSALKYFGFTPNVRKSFGTGVFRESCGGDYFMGELVRPYHLKKIPENPSDWISLANGLWRYSREGAAFRTIRRAWTSVLRCLPSDIRRLRGPERLGDTLLHDYSWNWWTRRKWQQDFYKVWTPVRRPVPLKVFHGETQLALALYGVPSSGLVPRDAVTGFRFGYARSS